MKLLLIRHGQTPGNVAGQLDTAFPGGPGLTELGERQAAALPEALADEAIEALYTSTLLRTHRTVAPLAKATGLEPTILDGVHEIEAGGSGEENRPRIPPPLHEHSLRLDRRRLGCAHARSIQRPRLLRQV